MKDNKGFSDRILNMKFMKINNAKEKQNIEEDDEWLNFIIILGKYFL